MTVPLGKADNYWIRYAVTDASGKPPPPPIFRWLVLFFISLAMFGNYYVYDAIAPIADVLKKSLGFSDQDIGSLYSMYSIAR